MKTRKTTMKVLALVGVLCGAIGVCSLQQTMAKADGEIATSGFEMSEGASVRLHKTELGIRWTTTVTKSYYNSIKTADNEVLFYTLIGPATEALKADITLLTTEYATANSFHNLLCMVEPEFTDEDENAETEDTFTYYGAITYPESVMKPDENTDYTLTASTMELIARAYVSVDGNITYAKANDTARSMKGVAGYCLENGLYTDYDLNKYVGDEDKTVTELTESKNGWYDSTKKVGKAVVAENLSAGEYIAYVGAKQVGKATVSGADTTFNFSALPSKIDEKAFEDGKDYSLRLVSADGEMYKTTFKQATNVITTQQELQEVFTATSFKKEPYNNNYIVTMTEFGGYYLLGNDINATCKERELNTVHRVLSPTSDDYANYYGESLIADYRISSSKVQRAWLQLYTGGLTGTFDGNGYSINNLMIFNYGLFGMVNGGTIKNLNMNNVQFTGSYGGGKATFGLSMYNAKLENVCVSTANISTRTWNGAGNIGGVSGGDARGWRALLSIFAGNVKMNNCVFTCEAIEGTDVANCFGYGSLFSYVWDYKDAGTQASSTAKYENVYVVSPHYLAVENAGSGKTGIAKVGDSEVVDLTGLGFSSDAISIVLTGITRYNNLQDMIDKKTENQYSAFENSEYWTLDSNGLPVWKN